MGGIKSKIKASYEAVKDLVSIPNINAPEFAFAGFGGSDYLDDNYSFGNDASYTIIVPLEIEGREVARATATYTQEELDKNEKLKNMMKGIKNV